MFKSKPGSIANALYNKIEELKNNRKQNMERINKNEEQLIDHINKIGSALVYKNDEPHILTVKKGTSRKFDKAKLAEDMGTTQAYLNVIGMAEIVEDGKITAEKLEEYYYEEPTESLRTRKASKRDIEELRSSGRI